MFTREAIEVDSDTDTDNDFTDDDFIEEDWTLLHAMFYNLCFHFVAFFKIFVSHEYSLLS